MSFDLITIISIYKLKTIFKMLHINFRMGKMMMIMMMINHQPLCITFVHDNLF